MKGGVGNTGLGRISACGGSMREGAGQTGNGNGRPRSERGYLPEQGLERRIGV